MPSLQLKTKLVFAITGMVLVIVATLAALYIAEAVHQRIQEASDNSELIGREVFSVARDALEVDLTSSRINLNNPNEVAADIEEVLETDSSVSALLDSVVGDSETVYYAAIVDARG